MNALSRLRKSETVRKHKEFLFPAVATYYQEPIALVRGEGFHVWDDQGNKYLDCFGGVLTVSVGHANPRVSEAIINQVKTLQHTSTLYANKPQSDLAEKLHQITPGRLKKSFFTNSGTKRRHAVHAASGNGRPEIVVLRHSSAAVRPLRFRDGHSPGACRLKWPASFMRARLTVIAARSISLIRNAGWPARMTSRN